MSFQGSTSRGRGRRGGGGGTHNIPLANIPNQQVGTTPSTFEHFPPPRRAAPATQPPPTAPATQPPPTAQSTQPPPTAPSTQPPPTAPPTQPPPVLSDREQLFGNRTAPPVGNDGLTEAERKTMFGTGLQRQTNVPANQYHTDTVTPKAQPIANDPNASQRWLTYSGQNPPTTIQERKDLWHSQLYNQNESRQQRAANNANRMHDQNTKQRDEQHIQNYQQRGLIEKQRQSQHMQNYDQRDTHQQANYEQRADHQNDNYEQRERHQEQNYEQRERHQRANINQRWWQTGIQTTGQVATGIGLGVGTYYLRQNLTSGGSGDQTAQVNKRFSPRDQYETSNGQLVKRFNDPRLGQPVGTNNMNMDTNNGYPDYMATMQPDGKRPVRERWDNGLKPDEIAQLGQGPPPPRDDRPHTDITVTQSVASRTSDSGAQRAHNP